MRTKLAGMLFLGVGIFVWSCGTDDNTSTDGDGSAGTGGSGTAGAPGAICGNGVVDPGETCDPPASCPTSCDDGDACTLDQLTGSAQNCNVACSNTAITACSSGDGCCPSGCTSTTDADCSGGTGGSGGATGGTGTGGTSTGGTSTGGTSTGGTSTGGTSTGGTTAISGPCDIYAAANPPTPCVAAYSTTRVLYSTYTGPLYQVRRGGSWNSTTGMTGGTFQDIGTVDGIHADPDAVDAFCAGAECTVSILYDQSGEGNDLPVGPAGCYDGGDGSAAEPNMESSATAEEITVNGHRVYSLKMNPHEGYRNNNTSGAVAVGEESQGIYMLADGTDVGVGCCWDFGNVSPSNCAQGTGSMDALFLGTGFFGTGDGPGPWFMGDFEFGVWPGGSIKPSDANHNPNLPSMHNTKYAFGILKTQTHPERGPEYTIRVAHPDTGNLITAWDGAAPPGDDYGMGEPWELEGAIVLGAGGDNSNWSWGTFYEGAMTAGRPSDETEAAVLANVQAARYGQ